MALNVLPGDGRVTVHCLPGPCAWPMARFLRGGVGREPLGSTGLSKGLNMKDYDALKNQELLDAMLADNAVKFGYTPDKTDHRLPELVKYLYVEDKGVNNAKGTHSRFALIKKEGGDILPTSQLCVASALLGQCRPHQSSRSKTCFFDLKNKLESVKSGKKKADMFNTRLCLTFAEAFWLP